MEYQPPAAPASPPAPPAKPGKKKIQLSFRTWIFIAAVAVFVIFILQNSEEVQVNFLLIDAQMPFYFALLIAGVLGAIIGWAISRMRSRTPQSPKK